jgi:hypothetical protein
MTYEFLKHEFSEGEQLWLQEVKVGEPYDARLTKAKLYGKIPKDFQPERIDRRFFDQKRLTALGVRVIFPDDEILETIDAIVVSIRDFILTNPGVDGLYISDIAQMVGKSEPETRRALALLVDLGQFFSGNSVGSDGRREYVWLTGDHGYDEFLQYESLDALLERQYDRQRPFDIFGPKQSAFDDIFPIKPAPDTSTKSPESMKPGTAFVIMAIDPEKPELVDVLQAIKESCKSFGIEARRVDEIEHQDRITNVILEEIRSCEFLIADLSHERPNVYYEIGYAHALNKKPILYRRKGTRIHFDLSLHNVPEYQNTTELKQALTKRLEAILGRSPG